MNFQLQYLIFNQQLLDNDNMVMPRESTEYKALFLKHLADFNDNLNNIEEEAKTVKKRFLTKRLKNGSARTYKDSIKKNGKIFMIPKDVNRNHYFIG